MMYSSAIFPRADATLEQAQQTKLARIIEALKLSRASTRAGNRQRLGRARGFDRQGGGGAGHGRHDFAGATVASRALVREEALDERVEFKLQDYRDVEGRFDRIVSIEMIEAVGREFIPRYFETIRDRLKPGGLCVLQAITIAEDRFADYCRRPDFIQRFIFPGGFLPSKSMLRETIERTGLRLVAAENFGDSYALTLREWRRRFLDAWPKIERLGFSGSFKRLWEYYLCYCEAGFRAGSVDVGLYSLAHAEPSARAAPV